MPLTYSIYQVAAGAEAKAKKYCRWYCFACEWGKNRLFALYLGTQAFLLLG